MLKEKIESSKQEDLIRKIIKESPIEWKIKSDSSGISKVVFSVDQEKLKTLKDKCGFRILVTDRDEWETAEIIHAYHGQANIENEFKNLKNPMHLSCRPQFHWTDQKIRVHFLICMIGHMLSMLLYKEAKEKLNCKECLRKFLDDLASIRLCSVLRAENSSTVKKAKTIKVEYALEEVTENQQAMINAFNIAPTVTCEGGVFCVGVY
jgi:transposase